ncbi:hypothetical protein INT48_006994 [Thamnidium elegans]|uniref:J domain-containing protein n=1 Tax=Thamnidium elegans TaxID=101142 RepID=A0A8H7VXE0_9FUNG|nr:hypothetical protein INT48_006994 [Thamnidium elegans]
MNNNNNNNKSPFDILGVNRFSTQKEIRRRYLDLCKKHHPDVSTNKTIDFREITVAYELLTNSKKNNNTTGVNWEQVQKTSINTRTWTRNSYFLGFGLTAIMILYLTSGKAPPQALLPHERTRFDFTAKEEEERQQKRDNNDTTTAPWQSAGMTFREWRKK